MASRGGHMALASGKDSPNAEADEPIHRQGRDEIGKQLGFRPTNAPVNNDQQVRRTARDYLRGKDLQSRSKR